MKKVFAVLLCTLLSAGMLTGCGYGSDNSVTYPIEQSTNLPAMGDDTAESPLGQFDETSAFGIVKHADENGMLLEMQGKYYLFGWTEKSKRHYDKLGIQLENEVGVQFEISDGRFIANSVELVTSGQ